MVGKQNLNMYSIFLWAWHDFVQQFALFLLSEYYKTVRANNSAAIESVPLLAEGYWARAQIASLLNITKGVKHERFVKETIQQPAGFHNNTADTHLSVIKGLLTAACFDSVASTVVTVAQLN